MDTMTEIDYAELATLAFDKFERETPTNDTQISTQQLENKFRKEDNLKTLQFGAVLTVVAIGLAAVGALEIVGMLLTLAMLVFLFVTAARGVSNHLSKPVKRYEA